MNKIYLLVVSIFLLVGCSKDTKDDEVIEVELKFTQFDVTLSTGEKSIGIIDEDNKRILLNGIEEPLDIVSVDYKYSEDVLLITPDPSTIIGKWSVLEKFRIHSSEVYEEYTIEIPDYVEPTYENKATIAPLEKFGRVTKYHMFDMNHNAGALNNISNAERAFGEAKMNGIRIPLYCGDAFGGHPTEGEVVESVYTTVLKSIENAKAAYSGTEPFMIFAGLKVLTSDKAEYFPDWVTTEEPTVANPIKYAQLVVDYIEFMHGKGHTIDYFAFDKEAARMDVTDFTIAVDELRARTASLGYVVPKIVAPEFYKPLGESGSFNDLYKINGQDRFDVFGNHYYLNHHNVTNHPDLKFEYELAQSDKYREAWATEAHWDKIRCSSDYEKESDIWSSEYAIGCMFDWTDLGLDLVSWWDYSLSGGNSPRNYIMRAYTESLIGSQPIRMLDHDGEEVLSRLKLHSRAYIRDNEVNVFFINTVSPCNTTFTPPFYEDYPVGILDGFKIDGNISVTRWDDDDQPSGESFVIKPVTENQFLIDITTGSFTHVSFKITQ
ncbi:hypothetical protein [Flavivirga jejuensis]|uniref:Uncharacterized protein n=1 Tax=Flavivirga jejuensis TaxID=870487 RepID=A0ABT8WJZ8_9FLAO|nr:hypothetical protein [Flavivirga jejuensis]MDO5973485.1 hypothetical protein [Flavivirga jejuensis]